jgi:predicted metal-binding protein
MWTKPGAGVVSGDGVVSGVGVVTAASCALAAPVCEHLKYDQMIRLIDKKMPEHRM